jgi:diadenosine tetraphosphate (Ap4A) HIT family hydrolase
MTHDQDDQGYLGTFNVVLNADQTGNGQQHMHMHIHTLPSLNLKSTYFISLSTSF